MPKRVQTPIPDADRIAAICAAGGAIPHDEAVALIADRLTGRAVIARRSREAKVRSAINRAIAAGRLEVIAPGCVSLAALTALAQATWQGNFSDLPRALRLSAEGGRFEMPPQRASLRYKRARPDSIPECHRIIGELEAEVERLSQALRVGEQRIADLEPDAELTRARRRTNLENLDKTRK